MSFKFNIHSITPVEEGGGATINNQDKTVTANGVYTADSGYTGLGEVTVNVPEPTGSINITSNGIVDVTSYASANVNVPAGADQKYGATINNFLGDVDANGVLQAPTSFSVVFNGVKSLGYSYANAFYYNEQISEISFPDLESVNVRDALRDSCRYSKVTKASFPKLKNINYSNFLYNAFYNSTLNEINFENLETITGIDAFYFAFYNTKLTSVEFPKLQSVSSNLNHTFQNCTSLQSISFPNLISVGGFFYTFYGCTSLTSVSFPVLATVSNNSGFEYAFTNCTSLQSISFPSLSSIKNSFTRTFSGCTSLQSISFPALKSTSFGGYNTMSTDMLSGVTGCTVHFPSNLQSVIGSWSDVANGFGGTNTTVLFDLPATE